MGETPDVALADTSPPPPTELARGATIGRYTIIRRLGAGGMGVVYLAFDPELDRRVAVKLLQTGVSLAGSEGPARLLREAQLMAKLSHPNVITVFDVGTFENDVFVAMEYVRGVTLREWLGTPRTPSATIAMCAQAGRGLVAAHQQGILHRDFKPENILVDEQGRARVLDFGLARSGTEEPAGTGRFELDDTLVGRRSSVSLPETQLGAVVGTPAYMAPEQLHSRPVDARCDQYAFCITVFEALYGARPFPGETLAEMAAEMEAGHIVVPPGKHVPRAVLPVLARGLAFQPHARWRGMSELLEALEGAAASEGRRRTVRLASLGVLLASLAVVLGVTRARRAEVCTGAEQSLAGVWDAPVRAEVAAAFRASGGESSEESLRRLMKALDDYAAGWVAMSTEACVATRVRGVQSDEALDLRSGCLRLRLDGVRALAELLRRADAPLVDNALASALRLEPLGACADVRALRAAYEPVAEAKRPSVEALRHDMANLVARLNAGRCAEAVPLAADVAARAESVGYLPVKAEAFYWGGRTAAMCRDPVSAADSLFTAVADAEQSHQDEIAAQALVALSQVRGSGLSQYDEGMSLARVAEAAIRRIGSPESLLATLAQTRGWIEYTHGNLDAALPLRREALEHHRRAFGDDDPGALQMRAELADLEFEAGHLSVSLAEHRGLFERSAALLGPLAQPTGRYALDIGETLAAQGKYEEAAPWLDRARPIVNAGILEHSKYVDAVEHIGLGDVERGAAELRAVVALAEKEVGPLDVYPLSTRGDLVKWLAVHRRPQALDESRALMAQLDELKARDSPWYSSGYAARAILLARVARAAASAGKVDDATLALATRAVTLAEHGAAELPYALLARGEVALARGDAAGAVAPLERARAMVSERGGIDAIIEGDIAFALARALESADPARSKELAGDARRAYGRSTERAFGGLVDDWLAGHGRR